MTQQQPQREASKIIDLVKEKYAKDEVFFSFEYFPPRTDQGVQNLYARIDRMATYKPLFIDVTWGAGGSTSDLTTEICINAHRYVNLDVQMHLTCTNMAMEKFKTALQLCKENGLRNILALRGDPPRGEEWKAIEGGFAHAADLVKYIRENYGDYFSIAVAGYPEKHVDCDTYENDLKHLKAKIDAGADMIITQLFYDVHAFFKFVKDCRALGITVPILPGIMPIRTHAGLLRMCKLGGTFIPPKILEDLEAIKDNDEAVQDYGVKQAAEMCRHLIEGGVRGLHFYTLNLEKSCKDVLVDLKLVHEEQLRRPLPWVNPREKKAKASSGQSSPRASRKVEDVRPIFWANRPKVYMARTEEWDEFPNGRWGDAESPSFSSLGDYHLKHLYASSAESRKKAYGEPKASQDVFDTFVKYLESKIERLPWNDSALSPESGVIHTPLIRMNKHGFLTINSQPRVNAVSSNDKVHGWGGPGGYVYQKAYIEFFCSPELLQKLRELLPKHPTLNYQAANLKGDLEGSLTGVAAVTWGVWPSSQIKQPTVVDPNVFFNVWREEAFALWESNWANLYPEDSVEHKVVMDVKKNYYLVNVIDNDFINGNIFAIFDEVMGYKEPAPVQHAEPHLIHHEHHAGDHKIMFRPSQ